MAFPYINAYQQFFDSSGDPLVSGTIEFRDPTSNSLINSYPTADDADAQTNANANPLTLNASGAASAGLFLEDGVAYKVILKDAAGNTVATQDDVLCPIGLPYLQTGAESAASVTPTNVEYPPGDVRRYGTVGDGITDDTAAIQAALDSASQSKGRIIIPDGTYLIDSNFGTYLGEVFGLRVKDNTEVYFEPGATLKSEDTTATNYAVLAVFGATNVLIHGTGTIDGNRSGHTGSTGEWGHCLDIKNSVNVTVRDIECKNGWGDGIYVGSTTTTGVQSTDIWLTNVRATNNRRNNISIVNVSRGGVVDSYASSANGTAPQAGIDVEPNAGASVKNFIIRGTTCESNTAIGLQVYGSAGEISRLVLSENICLSNTTDGINVTDTGFCVISKNQVSNNTGDGIVLTTSANTVVCDNIVRVNDIGISVLTSTETQVLGNQVELNREHGIFVDNVSPDTVISSNAVRENSQDTDVTYDNIIIDRNCDNCVVSNNSVKAGVLTNKPRYGININVSTVNNTIISGNNNVSGGDTAEWNDAGTGTVFSGNLPANHYATAAADDTTPSVKNLRLLALPANTGATAITALDDAVAGQIMTLRIDSSTNSSTIADGGNFALSAAWTPNISDTITLMTTDASVWQEISRSTN